MNRTSDKKSVILLVDDEINVLQSYEITLNSAGIDNLLLCSDSRKVKEILIKNRVELILLDLTMPYISGARILKMASVEFPRVPVIILTGNMELESAVESMKNGAIDYLVKPIEGEKLISTVERVLSYRDLKEENRILKEKLLDTGLKNNEIFNRLNSGNAKMLLLFKYAEAISKSPEPVLITGETGVGKELMARALHDMSGRTGKMVTVSIAGLDDNMLSDTLFGHKKGAFTDASEGRKGLLEEAAGGTLFLDEIGDLSIASQVKILRIIQEKEYFRLGEDFPRKTDTHIIAATNKNLTEMMHSDDFRKDLFYRLEVHSINIPPLRDRREDIPLLIDEFIDQAARLYKKKRPAIPKEIYILLKNYSFPGNIRELRSQIFNAMSTHTGRILSLETIRKSIFMKGDATGKSTKVHDELYQTEFKFPIPLPTIHETEKALINRVMTEVEGNQTIAAGILGITRQTLSKKIKDMNRV